MGDLETWVQNCPDYYEVTQAYKGFGRLKQLIILKERDIERIEQQIAVEEDKPRSNVARSRKISETSTLLDELAELKAQFAEHEAYVKSLEYAKSMFASSAYSIKMRFDSPIGQANDPT
jgi:hypothetical protein